MFSRPWPSIRPQPKPVEQTACECGDVVVRLLDANFKTSPPWGEICHCFKCRQWSGSHYRHEVDVSADKLVIEGSGKLGAFHEPSTIAGKISTIYFCARCGCDIVQTSAKAGRFCLSLGLFEQPPAPRAEMLAWQKVHWLRDKIDLPKEEGDEEKAAEEELQKEAAEEEIQKEKGRKSAG